MWFSRMRTSDDLNSVLQAELTRADNSPFLLPDGSKMDKVASFCSRSEVGHDM